MGSPAPLVKPGVDLMYHPGKPGSQFFKAQPGIEPTPPGDAPGKTLGEDDITRHTGATWIPAMYGIMTEPGEGHQVCPAGSI